MHLWPYASASCARLAYEERNCDHNCECDNALLPVGGRRWGEPSYKYAANAIVSPWGHCRALTATTCEQRDHGSVQHRGVLCLLVRFRLHVFCSVSKISRCRSRVSQARNLSQDLMPNRNYLNGTPLSGGPAPSCAAVSPARLPGRDFCLRISTFGLVPSSMSSPEILSMDARWFQSDLRA